MYARKDLPLAARIIARRQAGAIARHQLADAGVSPTTIKRLVRDGYLQRLARGVLVIGSEVWHSRAWAGILLGGDGACLAGLAAAHTWGMADAPESIEVRTLEHPRDREGFTFVRGSSEAVGPDLPRTSLAETAVTLASRARTTGDLRHRLTRAIAQGAPLADLVVAAKRIRTRRRKRDIVAALALLAPGIESVPEAEYHEHVELDHGLPEPERQVTGDGERVDLYYRGFGVIIELDGRTGHAGDGRFKDMRRDNRHSEKGLITLRFGWIDVITDPCGVAAQVARTLRARGWTGESTTCLACAA